MRKILRNEQLERGSIRLLLGKERLLRLTRCVLAAVPLWFAIGVVVSFAPVLRGGISGTIGISVAAVALSYSLGETLQQYIYSSFGLVGSMPAMCIPTRRAIITARYN